MPYRVVPLRAFLALLALLVLAPPSARGEEAPAGPSFAVLGDHDDLAVARLEGFCNTWLLTCKATRRFVVVDPCPEAVPAILAHRKAGHALETVWITHEHGDHLAGLRPLAAAVDVVSLGHPETQASLRRIEKEGWGWKDDEGRPLPVPPLLAKTIDEGDVVRVGELAWRVHHAPGHSKGALLFVLEGRYAVVGDVLFQGSVGRTDLPTSEKEVFGRSLEKLWRLPDAVVVLPGHMAPTTIGEEKAQNWLFQDFVREARGEPPIPRPWLGVQLDPEHEGEGIRLAAVVPEGPAARAGLQAGDVIVGLDGEATPDVRAFAERYRRHAVGDRVKVAYHREGRVRETTLEVGRRP